MSRAGDALVRFCTSLHDWPAASLCLMLSILQMVILDYYLIEHLGINHLTWIAADAIAITLLCISIHQARMAIRSHDRGTGSGNMGWIAWLFMSISVAAKTVVIFHLFATELDEADSSFWGPNTLKTTIALGSCTFILLLITQHDAPQGSDGRRYIEELTGSVAFDILDTVDIMEVLFDADMRPQLWTGLEEFILAVATLNLLIPTVPLITLAKTRFGQQKPSTRLVRGHRLLLILMVNVPNLLVRMLLWHGLSAGISPFTLKNIILILITLYEFYEHKKEEFEDKLEANRAGHDGEVPAARSSKKMVDGESAGNLAMRDRLPSDDGSESSAPSRSQTVSELNDQGTGSPSHQNGRRPRHDVRDNGRHNRHENDRMARRPDFRSSRGGDHSNPHTNTSSV